MELPEAQGVAMKEALDNGHTMSRWTVGNTPLVKNAVAKCVFCKQHVYITENGISGGVIDNRCPRAWYFTEYRG